MVNVRQEQCRRIQLLLQDVLMTAIFCCSQHVELFCLIFIKGAGQMVLTSWLSAWAESSDGSCKMGGGR